MRHRSPNMRVSGLVLTLLTLAVAVSAALAALAPSKACAISRSTVLRRAQSWVDSPVKYSQRRYHRGYRTDCSGYVSMCWATRMSWATSIFHIVTHPIHSYQLQPGDAMLKRNYHIRLFYGWADTAHRYYYAYESGYGKVAVCRLHRLSDDLRAGYRPTRYDHISGRVSSSNTLKNGSFNSWVKTWSGASEQPAWWTVSGPGSSDFALRRQYYYHTARNSLRLVNPSEDPDDFTEMYQVVPAKPKANYVLSAWVRTPCDAAGLTFRVFYVNSKGETLAEYDLSGAGHGLNDYKFKRLSKWTTAPSGTTRAVVRVYLAGGNTTSTRGAVSPGTYILLDDVSLVRPRAWATIRAHRSWIRRGHTIYLGGLVGPKSMAGVRASVYVQRPHSRWARFTKTTLVTASKSAAWHAKYRISRRARKGTYRFRVVTPYHGGYLGATSRKVSVRVR